MNIEERLARLESLVGSQNEALTPNYLTYDPATGQVGASFSGVISAQGVVLPTGPSVGGVTDVNRVQWKNTAGARIGELTTSDDGLESRLAIDVKGSQAGNIADIDLIATEFTSGSGNAGLFIGTRGGGNIRQVTAFAQGSILVFNPTIIDENGASNFVQSTSLRQLALDTGQSSTTFTASANSANAVVPHNLGRTPIAVVATTLTAPAFAQIIVWNTFAFTTTNFTINGLAPGGAFTGAASFSWIAVA